MITHDCTHPAAEHTQGGCGVRFCPCRHVALITLRRCGCPYRDCFLLIDTPSGLCPTCERVCVEAWRIDHPD